MKTEQQIKEDIATLRESGASNDELIREAIHRIFYDMRENPSQARVLEVVRSPGKSPGAATVQSRVNAFWNDLRKRSATPLSCPGVPSAVLTAFEQVVPNVWIAAQAAAQESLAALSQDMESKISEAQTLARLARDEADAQADIASAAAKREAEAIERAQEEAKRAAEANQMRESAERDLAAAQAAHSEALAQIEEWQKEAARAQAETERVRSDADARMDKVRAEQDRQVAELRKEMSKLESLLTASQETVSHLRVEIDREVSQSERRRTEVEAAKAALADARIAHGKEVSVLRTEVTAAGLALAESKGKLEAVVEERERVLGSLGTALQKIAKLEYEIGFIGPRKPHLQ